MQELDYHIPPPQLPVPPAQRWIGLSGFLAYAVLAVPCDVGLIGLLREGVREPAPFVIVGSTGGFCTWRAIAGLMQFLKRQRDRW